MAGQQVFQQFKGAMSELAHSVTKLVITQGSDAAGGMLDNLGGVGASAVNAVGGIGTAVTNVAANFAGGKRFEVQINPENYERHYGIQYGTPAIKGASAPIQQFDYVIGERLTIKFTLDGTGVIPPSLSSIGEFAKGQLLKTVGLTDVSYVTNRIKELREVVGDFIPAQHSTPTVLTVSWGDVPPFTGVLEGMTANYNLFLPSGIPIRAEVTLTFKQHQATPVPEDAGGAIAGVASSIPSSPDMTHRRHVTDHDTLPLLCRAVYKDALFYWQVAQANGLTQFRRLKEGSDLYFPPLDRSTQA
jgi:hypothetical protein